MTKTGLIQAYAGPQPPERFNMAAYALLAGGAPRDKVALLVVDGGSAEVLETWTYAALQNAVLCAAFYLSTAHALPPQSRVLIRLRTTSAYAIAVFGALAAGLVPVAASPDLSEREVSFLLSDSEATSIILDETLPCGALPAGITLVTARAFNEAIVSGPLAEFAHTKADDPAFLVYTSGTTAQPKGVLHGHRSAWGRRPMYGGWYGLTAQDRVLHAGTLNWTYTLGAGLTDPWANGATAIVCVGEKTPATWPRLIRDHDVTIFAAVPGVFRQILKYADVSKGLMPALRHGLSAGEALAENVALEWLHRTGVPLYEALGQSEISTYISSSPSVPPRRGFAGKAQPGRCVTILGEDKSVEPLDFGQSGLIAVHRSDPGLMLGYWRRPDEEMQVFRGDWFVGGDAGLMDEDGYIAHLGRCNDIMNAGGFRVSPIEVEQQLALHPAVLEVAVTEVQAGRNVSIVAAFIVPRAEAEVSAEILGAFAAGRLAVYKRPKQFVFVNALPRTSNGKIKRAELKAMFKEHVDAQNFRP